MIYSIFYIKKINFQLLVTLIPEVDSQVTSSGDGRTCASSNTLAAKNLPIAPSTVIPPTTIVCLPTTNSLVPPPPPSTQLVTSPAVSSSALPYIALTTSTPVRAVLTKTQVKVWARQKYSGRYSFWNFKDLCRRKT